MNSDGSSPAAIEVRGLREYYGRRLVLDVPALSFARGRMHVVVGGNGAGKTTLISILALVDKPAEGEVLYGGRLVTPNGRAGLRMRRRVALVAQDPYIFDTSVLDNATYGLRQRGVGQRDIFRRASASLEKLGLGGLERRPARELSGGEAKRLAIARAVVLEPDLLLLDEPTANVDRHHISVVESIIRELQETNGATVVMTTHDLQQAQRLGDELISLAEGRIVPLEPDNVFRARIARDAEGVWAETEPRLRVYLRSVPAGVTKATIGIDANDIIVSLEPFSSSARNCFQGRVREIVQSADGVRLSVDAGATFYVALTRRSTEEMGLSPGTPVYVTFKSSSVRIL